MKRIVEILKEDRNTQLTGDSCYFIIQRIHLLTEVVLEQQAKIDELSKKLGLDKKN